MHPLLSLFIILFLLGCNSGGGSSISSSSSNAYLTIEANLISNSPRFSENSTAAFGERTVFAALWDTTLETFPSPGADWSTKYTMRGSIEQTLSETHANSLFSRVRPSFLIICLVDELAAKGSDGLPSLGAGLTIDVNTSNSEVLSCFKGKTTAANNYNGQTITYDISVPGSTTNYDYKATMNYASNNFMGSNNEIYYRNTSTTFNLLHIEKKTFDSGATFDKDIHMTVLSYDKINGKVSYQHITDNFAGSSGTSLEIYRVYYDLVEKVGRIIAFMGNSDPAIGDFIQYTMTGNSNMASLLGVSVGWDVTNQAASSLNGVTNTGMDYNACVSGSEGAMINDNDITAAVCGKEGLVVSNVSIFATLRAFTAQGNYNPSSATTPNFNYDNIGTQPLN